jgi:hypothetical protein
MSDQILLAHGGGGSLMQQLIRQELLPLYGHRPGESLPVLHDAALLEPLVARWPSRATAMWCSPWSFRGVTSAGWR